MGKEVVYIEPSKFTKSELFGFKISARLYAWYKRRRGFTTMTSPLLVGFSGQIQKVWRVRYVKKEDES